MAKTSETALPWRVQWHVTADGTVIRQRSRGDQPHQQLFQTFNTIRPVTVAELDALSARSRHELSRVTPFQVLWLTGLALWVIGVTVGACVLFDRAIGSFVPGLIVGPVLASALLTPMFRLFMVFISKDAVGPVEQLWHDAGLESSTGVTMKATEARALIEAPGTTSGAETRLKRA